MRLCTLCEMEKPLADFEGSRRQCRPCRSRKQVQRVQARRTSDEPRTCARCRETKPSSDFGSKSWCLPCSSVYYSRQTQARSEEQRAAKSAQRRAWYLKKTYGMTVEQYEALLARQGGGCAICGATRGASDRESLCVDHNHVTGAPRALLCVRCNLSVRDLGDDLSLAEKVLAYIRLHTV